MSCSDGIPTPRSLELAGRVAPIPRAQCSAELNRLRVRTAGLAAGQVYGLAIRTVLGPRPAAPGATGARALETQATTARTRRAMLDGCLCDPRPIWPS